MSEPATMTPDQAAREWQRYRQSHPIPAAVRREVVARAGGHCEDCGDRGPLELHHLVYMEPTPEGEESILGRETAEDLRALCRDCHRGRHRTPGGGFEADPVDAADQWASFESWTA